MSFFKKALGVLFISTICILALADTSFPERPNDDFETNLLKPIDLSSFRINPAKVKALTVQKKKIYWQQKT